MSGFFKFLKHWAKRLPYIRPLVDERNRLRLDVDRLEAAGRMLHGNITALQSHVEQVRVERDRIADNRDRLEADVERLASSLRQMESERTALHGSLTELQVQAGQLRIERNLARAEASQLTTWAPPGHFYSPVVSIDEIRMREAQVFGRNSKTVAGIDLREADQIELLKRLEHYYGDIDFPESKAPPHRYYFENPNYSYADAILYYSMIRHLKPRRIVEIGSGFSSCLALDANERCFKSSIQCTFIEPYPQLLRALLKPGDEERIKILWESVHEVDESVFLELEENDILFIDSTHVSKTNSDVNHLLFQVLPILKCGVYVHFHDIFFPFEYPKDWIYEGRSWNECYALRAFLQGNHAFTVQLFADFIAKFHNEFLREHMPMCLKNTGGSIWLKKVVDPDPDAIREMRQRPRTELPTRVDLVQLIHPKQLGPGWHQKEQSQRWMGKRGEVRLKGPGSIAQRLWIQATNENPRSFELTICADGISLGTTKIDTIGPVRTDFALPADLVGKEIVVIALEVSETLVTADDGRELGLALGVIEIR